MTNMDGDNVAPPRHVHVHAPDEEYGFEEGADEVTKVGRRRQVIGILVRVVLCRAKDDERVDCNWGRAGVAIGDHDPLAGYRLDAVDIPRVGVQCVLFLVPVISCAD